MVAGILDKAGQFYSRAERLEPLTTAPARLDGWGKSVEKGEEAVVAKSSKKD
jgi:hypothetical protein